MPAQLTTIEPVVRMAPIVTRPPTPVAPVRTAPWVSPRVRAAFLERAGHQLAASPDLERAVWTMADLAVPELADACVVYALGGQGGAMRGAARHHDSRSQQVFTELAFGRTGHSTYPPAVLNVVRTGRASVLSTAAIGPLFGRGGNRPEVLRQLGFKAALVMPVTDPARARALGGVVFLSERPRAYPPGRVRLAEALATQFGLALAAAPTSAADAHALARPRESLAATIHDLMSPLAYIRCSAQLLRRLEPHVDPSAHGELERRAEGIAAAASRIADMLAALLERTPADVEDVALAERPAVDLLALVRRVVGQQQVVAGHERTIQLLGSPPPLCGRWDAEQLERLLSNLIENAVKYSPHSAPVEVRLEHDADSAGGWAVLQVSDRGRGIPAGDLPFIFEPFHRGSNVGAVPGTGLGLASAWQVVTSHGGRLWVDSVEGRGTCMTVRLPLEPEG